MYFNNVHILIYVAIAVAGFFIGKFVNWCNYRLPEYKKVFSKEGFISYAELEAPIKEEAMELANGLPYNATDDFKVKIEACLHKGHVDIVINEIVKEQQDVRIRFYKNIVGFADDVEFSSPDLSDIKPTLEYLYHIEDYILEDFENINAETAFMFKHILTAIEPKYFELKKADNAPKK